MISTLFKIILWDVVDWNNYTVMERLGARLGRICSDSHTTDLQASSSDT